MRGLFEFVMALVSSPQYLHTVHVRAKLVEVLHHTFAPAEARNSNGKNIVVAEQCAELFRSHPLGHRFLSPGLIELFGDVEKLPDAHSFGDLSKLGTRMHIASMLKVSVWMCVCERVQITKKN